MLEVQFKYNNMIQHLEKHETIKGNNEISIGI